MATTRQALQFYQFGPFRIDVAERVLQLEGERLTLTPKAFDLLLLLVENQGHLLEKDDLMKILWPNTFVEEANLSNNISQLRKVLSADPTHQYIETVPRRGYRFVAKVAVTSAGPEIVSNITMEAVIGELSDNDSRGSISETSRRIRIPRFALVFTALLALGFALYFWLRNSATQQSIRTIAVLPFKPLAADSSDESLEMGMADTLITRLSNVRQLIVRPTSAVRKYATLDNDELAAGRDQKVDAVLEGNIQKSADKIRVTVRLVRVADGSLLWADHFDEKFTNLFAVQDSISERVAGALAVKLTGDERESLTKRYTANTEAYQLYLRGRFFLNKSTEADFRKSVDYFQQALEKDPNYALAYAGLADSYVQLGFYGLMPANESHSRAKEAAARALQIDDRLGEAHASLAIIMTTYYWDWEEAEKQFKRAIELVPNYSAAHNWYAQYLSFTGRHDEALKEAMRAQEIDPLSLFMNSNIGLVLFLSRQYDSSIAATQKTLELDPGFPLAHMIMGLSYVQMGLHEKAISALQKASAQPDSRALLGYVLALAGRDKEARKILDELEQESKKKYVAPAPVAITYIGLGQKDRAMELLEKAYDERLWEMGMLKVNPVFDPLRSDPRFERLVQRVGLP
jgi:DNA-binding winged helix-turn-helix (wHTH) protein/TolB-like protein/Flp pilus assembly protein TadD